MMQVEVIFAQTAEQTLYTVAVPAGATVHEAITASKIVERYPQLQVLAPSDWRIAIFGRMASLDQKLHANDRVELLRALVDDPKANRRERVNAARKAQRRAENGHAAAPDKT